MSNAKNPWLGLQTYAEGQRLYGRTDEILDLSHKIRYNRQTVVLGKSGIGKSSLLNAGVFPILRKSGLFPVDIRLVHNCERSYLSQIRIAVKESLAQLRRETTDGKGNPVTLINLCGQCAEICPAVEGPDEESLWEYFRRHQFFDDMGNNIEPVIVIDQFEEIFTLCKSEKAKLDFFSQLADLLNDAAPEYVYAEANVPQYPETVKFHVVITLRDDFLSYLEQYTSSIPPLKHNHFYLNPLSEDQAAEVIMEPVPGLVSEEVAIGIISRVTGFGPDKFTLFDGVAQIQVDSAILSLFLCELYDAKAPSDKEITKELLKDKGADIITSFYLDTVCDPKDHSKENKNISRDSVEYLEDKLVSVDGRRDSIFKSDAVKTIPPQEINYLSGKRILHEYPWNNGIRIELMHDVLCPVIVERRKNRQTDKWIKEERRKQELARQEADRQMADKAEYAKQLYERTLEKARVRKQFKVLVAVFGATLFLFMLLWFGDIYYSYRENEKEYADYYTSYTQFRGWPVGEGKPMTDKQRRSTPLYYKLSYMGNSNKALINGKIRYTRVTVCSSNKRLPTDYRLPDAPEWNIAETDAENSSVSNVMRRAVTVEYSPADSAGMIGNVKYLDASGAVLMRVSYSHKSANEAQLHYESPDGEPMSIRGNGICRTKLLWDRNGHTSLMMFLDKNGVRRDISNGGGIMGYAWQHGGDTTIRIALNEYGMPNTDLKVNMTATYHHGDTTVVKCYHCSAAHAKCNTPQETVNEAGYSKRITAGNTTWFYKPGNQKSFATQTATKDSKGNTVELRTEGDTLRNRAPIVRFAYEDGLMVCEEHLEADGKTPYRNAYGGIYKREFAYDNSGERTKETRTDTNGTTIYRHERATTRENGTIRTVTLECDTTRQLITIKETSGDNTTVTYLDTTKMPVNIEVSVGNTKLCVHKVTTKRTPENTEYTITREFYRYNNGRTEKLPKETALQNGRWVTTSYFRRIEEYDADGNLKAERLEDANGAIVGNMMYIYENGQCVGRAARGISGEPVRCPDWEKSGYMYYKMYYYSDDSKSNDANVTIRNEWDENSALVSGTDQKSGAQLYFAPQRYQFKNGIISLGNASKGKVTVYKEYEQIWYEADGDLAGPELPYVHFHSPKSSLLNSRTPLHDGDIIIRLGDWQIMPNGKPGGFGKQWESLIAKGGEMEAVVLRANAVANKYDRLTLLLKCDGNEADYVKCHPMRLKTEEYKFFEAFLTDTE